VTIEEFQNLHDRCRIFYRHHNGTEVCGTVTILGNDWCIQYDNGSRATGRMDEMQCSDLWLLNIHIANPPVEHAKMVLIAYTGTIPSGYEATGEFRQPVPKDCYLHQDGKLVVVPNEHKNNTLPVGPRLILRPVTPPWTAPKWMKPGCWLWSNNGVNWSISNMRPIQCERHYAAEMDSIGASLGKTYEVLFGHVFTPPPFTGWKESLRQIPEHGA
jgi:hypothetical protein